jgi:uncharacterized protein YbbK (DUF523 family)
MESGKKKQKALISACLIGRRCRYDGQLLKLSEVSQLIEVYELIPVCPEVDGGLKVPRPKAWIKNGTGADVLDSNTIVINENGQDVTSQFISGAEIALKQAILLKVKIAIFKSKSPSCGKGQVYNGDKLVEGNGVTTELLIRNGINVKTV